MLFKIVHDLSCHPIGKFCADVKCNNNVFKFVFISCHRPVRTLPQCQAFYSRSSAMLHKSNFHFQMGTLFLLHTVCLSLISVNITTNHTLPKTRCFGLHFCCSQYGYNFNHWTAIMPFRVIQCHHFWYQSKACMRLHMFNYSNLHLYLALFPDYVRLLV